MNLVRSLQQAGQIVKRNVKLHRSTIMSVSSIAGVVGTFIFTIKANDVANERKKKAEEAKGEPLTKFETFKAEATAYVGPALLCAGTSGMIAANDILNVRERNDLTGFLGAAIASEYYYRNKIKDVAPEVDNDINSKIAEETADKLDQYYSPSEDDNMELYFDALSKRYYWATPECVMTAETVLNKCYAYDQMASINTYYEALQRHGAIGIEPQRKYDLLGWSKWHIPVVDSMPAPYIDMFYIPQKIKRGPYEGLEYTFIEMAIPPEAGYLGY